MCEENFSLISFATFLYLQITELLQDY